MNSLSLNNLKYGQKDSMKIVLELMLKINFE